MMNFADMDERLPKDILCFVIGLRTGESLRGVKWGCAETVILGRAVLRRRKVEYGWWVSDNPRDRVALGQQSATIGGDVSPPTGISSNDKAHCQ